MYVRAWWGRGRQVACIPSKGQTATLKMKADTQMEYIQNRTSPERVECPLLDLHSRQILDFTQPLGAAYESVVLFGSPYGGNGIVAGTRRQRRGLDRSAGLG